MEIERVPCHSRVKARPSTLLANVGVDDGPAAGPVRKVSQSLDPESRHHAAELFVDLAPGCYQVLAVPAAEIDGAAWAASTDCSRAASRKIQVTRGRTAVASLLPQCDGDLRGERDVLAGLNRPPTVTLDTAALFAAEWEPVRACATVTDPDDDPVTVSFAAATPSDTLTLVVGEPTLLGFEAGRRLWQVCADIVGASTASYEIRAVAHDLGWSLGKKVRLEELVAPAASHASVTLPLHVSCVDAPCS